MMILIIGGSASGKSAFAEDKLLSFGDKKRYYLATMAVWDEECRERIRRHRIKRSGKGFSTIEKPVDLKDVSLPGGSAVLLECVSNLTANELFREELCENGQESEETRGAGREQKAGGLKEQEAVSFREQKAWERITGGIFNLKEQAEDLVVVTNEVFSDGISYDPGTEQYLRLLGKINCWLADMADEVYEVSCGFPICVKCAENSAQRAC